MAMPTKAARANDSLVDSFAPFSFRYPRDITWSVLQISKTLRLSEHTVHAIRHREAQDIAERKKSLAAMLTNVAELGAGRMEETVGKVGCRDAAILTGIATDTMLALTGQTSVEFKSRTFRCQRLSRTRHAVVRITRLMRLRACFTSRSH